MSGDLWQRHRGLLELAAVGFMLAIVAALVYGPQALDGGFLGDAWSNRAIFVFSDGSGFFGKLSDFLSMPHIAVRPLQAFYLVALNSVFGSHVGFWLSWQVVTTVLMCVTLYLLLRRLSLGPVEAGTIALLVLLFPAASSTRFWLATIWAPASLTLVFLGYLLAFSAFDAKRQRNQLLLHAASLALFVASLLLYEIALLLMLSSVLVYRLRVPWTAAAKRWVVDCAVLGILALTVTTGSDAGHVGTEVGVFEHGKVIAEQARTLLMTVVLPLNSGSWYMLLLVALVPALGVLGYRLLPAASPTRPELRRWLIAMAAGLAIVVLGYVVYAPGTDYYQPMGPGIMNRVNFVPSFGWVLMLYAGFMLIATLALRELPNARRWAAGVASVACLLIAIGWLKPISTYSDYFTRAYAEDVRVLATMKQGLPKPREGSTIWTFGQPVEVVPGVPVFGNTWDMTSSVQLNYDDGSLISYVAYPETTFACTPHGVQAGGPRYAPTGQPDPIYSSPYGLTYFVETSSGETIAVENRKQCRRAVDAFPLAPLYAAP